VSVRDQAIITITPSTDQYRQLVADLEKLLANGFSSNTAAICEAVHRLADYDSSSKEMAEQRSNAPGPEPRR
jgi:hypothetical protein